MVDQKELYEKSGGHMRDDIKIDLMGWPKSTHSAAIKFVDINSGDRLLEVGCGRGLHFKYYLKKTDDVYGLDISKKLLDEMGLKDRVKLFEGNIDDGTKFENNFFDVIVMVDVIEHTINRYLVLKELKRILKKNGRLVIITPNFMKLKNRIRFLFGKYPHTAAPVAKGGVDFYDGGHLQYFTFKTLREAIERGGFKVEGEYGFGRFGKLHNFLNLLCLGLFVWY